MDEELNVNHILITEVANKNQQILLDSKDKINDDNIIKYENTKEAKDEEEKSDLDNL